MGEDRSRNVLPLPLQAYVRKEAVLVHFELSSHFCFHLGPRTQFCVLFSSEGRHGNTLQLFLTLTLIIHSREWVGLDDDDDDDDYDI